ncbi:MAG: class I adenylate-forming enzyme family protein, partial [Halobacteriales archaeon]
MTGGAPPVATIPEALGDAVERYGNDPFLHYHDRTLSFEALDRESNGLAAGLRANGVGHGDTVGLLLYNSLEYVELYVAIAKIGATVVPIDTRFEGETLRSVIETAGVETIVVDARTRPQYESIRGSVSVRNEYLVDEAGERGGYDPLDDVRGDTDESIRSAVTGGEPASITFVQRDPANPPNGVVLPQYSYVNTAREIAESRFDFSRADRLYTTLPLYSIFTFQVGIMAALRAGAQIAIDDPFDPAVYWDRVKTHDASILLYLGRMLSVLNAQRSEDHHENPAETVIGHGFGFGTDESLIREFERRFDVTVFEGYGTTETGTIAAFNGPGQRQIGSSGRPVSYAEVAIVDEDDWEVPRGESGEIVVRPTHQHAMYQGYFDDPHRTVERRSNLWIHTGDIGYL